MSTLQVSMPNLIKAYAKQLAIAWMTITLVIFAWANIFFQTDITANAATMDGISNQVEGKIDQGMGRAKRGTGDVTDDYRLQTKGGLQQVKGDAKQGLGTAKNKLDDAKGKAEDKSENIIDSVKDFFN